ncbi:MAG: CoA pyrophosphatase [Pseudomonadota bacterium]
MNKEKIHAAVMVLRLSKNLNQHFELQNLASDHLVLIQRVAGLRHGKEIAFPGGVIEKEDDSALTAALRETEEELGIPRHIIQHIQPLPSSDTLTGYRIWPFLGTINTIFEWNIHKEEVHKLFLIPLDDTHQQTKFEMRWIQTPTLSIMNPTFTIDREKELVAWGATGRILWQALHTNLLKSI